MATKADVLAALDKYKEADKAAYDELHQFDGTDQVPTRSDTDRWYKLHCEAEQLRQDYNRTATEWRESLA